MEKSLNIPGILEIHDAFLRSSRLTPADCIALLNKVLRDIEDGGMLGICNAIDYYYTAMLGRSQYISIRINLYKKVAIDHFGGRDNVYWWPILCTGGARSRKVFVKWLIEEMEELIQEDKEEEKRRHNIGI